MRLNEIVRAERRIALVSGANRGLGREIARRLAADGYLVIAGSRDAEKGAEALAGVHGEVQVKQLDVSDPASVERLVSELEAEHGRLDVLVNNAGVAGDTSHLAAEADLDSVKETLDTNLFGAWRLTQAVLPLMERNGYGRIVNMSTGMAQLSDMGGGAPAYRVSKTALNALTRTLSNELGEGIKVNSVCPGWVRTDMGGSGARLSVEEGADTPVWLATLPDDGPSGGFFRDGEPVPW